MNYFQVLLIASLVTGCTLAPVSRTSDYHEDLSVYRIDYTGEVEKKEETSSDTFTPLPADTSYAPVSEITKELDQLLDSITVLNLENGYVNGYCIQIYHGRERDQAAEVKNKAYQVMDNSRPTVHYDPPYFTVRVGRFINRIDAYKTFDTLRKSFPSAIIVPERIPINE